MSAGNDLQGRPNHYGLHRVRAGAGRSSAERIYRPQSILVQRTGGDETHLCHWMDRHTFERALKRGTGVGKSALPQSERSDRIPRVGAALACVQLTGVLERQLDLEVFKRARL